MPPKCKSRAGGNTKHKIQKAPVKVKAVSRATRVQNQGDQVATPLDHMGGPGLASLLGHRYHRLWMDWTYVSNQQVCQGSMLQVQEMPYETWTLTWT